MNMYYITAISYSLCSFKFYFINFDEIIARTNNSLSDDQYPNSALPYYHSWLTKSKKSWRFLDILSMSDLGRNWRVHNSRGYHFD